MEEITLAKEFISLQRRLDEVDNQNKEIWGTFPDRIRNGLNSCTVEQGKSIIKYCQGQFEIIDIEKRIEEIKKLIKV